MKTIIALTAIAVALTATAGFAADMRKNDGRTANRAWYEGNPQRIYNAHQNANLSSDTARGGSVGWSNMGHDSADHGRTYNGEQTSSMVVKH